MTAAFYPLFAVFWAFAEASVENGLNRRQVHHTNAPHNHATTSRPTDPLAAWMSSTSSQKPNILFLVADDFRPKLGSYGEDNMVTPNLDLLASKSLRFDQAFAQVALCSPSRTSFLTGRRPDTTHVYDLDLYFRNVGGNFTTLPEFFKNNGYFTQASGKIFHMSKEASGIDQDSPYSWSNTPYKGTDSFDEQQRKAAAVQPVNETKVGKLIDTDVADFAVNFLRQRHHHNDQPFFLAVGFRKPHLPWIFPREYMDLYPRHKIHLAQHRIKPPGLPEIAFSKGDEIRGYGDVMALNVTDPDGIIPDHDQVRLRQGYSAATSHMDAQVGRVLEALTQYGFAGNTIITFLGDHGWHLGDNAEWCKHTNYEMALRIPMMIYVPEVTAHGHHFEFIDALAPTFDPTSVPHHFGGEHSTQELAEAIDLYPTLVELSGLHVPGMCPEDSKDVPLCLEGTSLVPLIRKAKGLPGAQNAPWKDAVFSQYHRKWNSDKHTVMGYSIRTNNGSRYTEWVHFDKATFQPQFHKLVGRELYHHHADPFEFHNLVEKTSFSAEVSELSHRLRQGWRHTMREYLRALHSSSSSDGES